MGSWSVHNVEGYAEYEFSTLDGSPVDEAKIEKLLKDVFGVYSYDDVYVDFDTKDDCGEAFVTYEGSAKSWYCRGTWEDPEEFEWRGMDKDEFEDLCVKADCALGKELDSDMVDWGFKVDGLEVY